VITQHLVFRDALWSCPSCAAQLGSDDEGSSLDHADDCAEVAAMAVHWNWPPDSGASRQEVAPAADPPEYRSCHCGPDGQEHWHTIPPRFA
jgi:hypothetical protein